MGRVMTKELENWARAERTAIREEIKWLKAGGKWLSPSGDNITPKKLEELEARLEHVNSALVEIDKIEGT